MSIKNQSQTLQIHELPVEFEIEEVESQLEQVRRKNTIRVAIVGKKAYWVHNYTFYESDIVNGEIDNEAARPINTENMSRLEINTLMSVLDKIS